MALHKVKKPNSVFAGAKKKKICFSFRFICVSVFNPKSLFMILGFFLPSTEMLSPEFVFLHKQ